MSATAERGLRLLLVEDNAADALLVRNALAMVGWRLEHVGRVSEALGLLSRSGVDAVLLDLRLPDAHGLDGLERIRTTSPGVPVIVLTGFDDERTAVSAVQAGAQDYLVKDQVSHRSLARSVRYSIERHRADEARSRLAAIVESSSDAIIGAGLDDRVATWNPAAERMYGYALPEIEGRPLVVLFPPDAQPGVLHALAAVKRDLRADDQETAGLARDGHRFDVGLTVSPIRDRGGQVAGTSSIVRDVSQRKRVEAELAEARKMEAVARVVRGMAHEVFNPLFGATAVLDAFEARFGQSVEAGRYIAFLRAELDRLNRLMKELIDYVTPAGRELVADTLLGVLARARDACRAQARVAEVEIVERIDDALPGVRIYSSLAQAFEQILRNAVQHSPAGGIVSVHARKAPLDDQNWVECTVRDSGPGIAEQNLAEIFEPFFTTRSGATGLGLAIARRILRDHGGTISANNQPEGGLCVTLRLPVL